MSDHAPLPHHQPPAPPAPRPIDQLLRPFQHFLRQSTTGGVLVMVATVIALILANGPLHHDVDHLLHTSVSLGIGPLQFSSSCWHLINDGLMALFFLLVGLEIRRELTVGELRDPRKAALPVAAALGGMVVPAGIYALINHGGPGAAGWGVPMATDIAFALGILRLAGAVPVGALVFLAALAIVDDLGAVLVIAVFYTSDLHLAALGAAAGLVVAALAMNRLGVRHPLPYILVGVVLWMAVLASGVHATVAGVLLAFCLPSTGGVDPDHTIAWTARFAEAELKTPNTGETIEALSNGIARGRSPMAAWEHALAPWATVVIVPIFALANAGVVLDATMVKAFADPIFWGTALGLVVGKPLGVVGASLVAVRLGWAGLPAGMDRRGLFAVGCLAGVGFTMALFIGDLAFGPGDHLTTAKAAILMSSLVAGVVGFAACRRFLRPTP